MICRSDASRRSVTIATGFCLVATSRNICIACAKVSCVMLRERERERVRERERRETERVSERVHTHVRVVDVHGQSLSREEHSLWQVQERQSGGALLVLHGRLSLLLHLSEVLCDGTESGLYMAYIHIHASMHPQCTVSLRIMVEVGSLTRCLAGRETSNRLRFEALSVAPSSSSDEEACVLELSASWRSRASSSMPSSVSSSPSSAPPTPIT